MEQKSKALPIILIILLVLVLCCIVISVGLIAGGVWLNDKVNTSGGYNFPAETGLESVHPAPVIALRAFRAPIPARLFGILNRDSPQIVEL